MKDLRLINYLRRHLRFGCIKHALFEELIDEDGKLNVILRLTPFSRFYENDRHFIRCNVLESEVVRSFEECSLKTLHLCFDKIVAVYVFS